MLNAKDLVKKNKTLIAAKLSEYANRSATLLEIAATEVLKGIFNLAISDLDKVCNRMHITGRYTVVCAGYGNPTSTNLRRVETGLRDLIVSRLRAAAYDCTIVVKSTFDPEDDIEDDSCEFVVTYEVQTQGRPTGKLAVEVPGIPPMTDFIFHCETMLPQPKHRRIDRELLEFYVSVTDTLMAALQRQMEAREFRVFNSKNGQAIIVDMKGTYSLATHVPEDIDKNLTHWLVQELRSANYSTEAFSVVALKREAEIKVRGAIIFLENGNPYVPSAEDDEDEEDM